MAYTPLTNPITRQDGKIQFNVGSVDAVVRVRQKSTGELVQIGTFTSQLLEHSTALDNPYWLTTLNANDPNSAGVVANALAAPDGTVTADRFIEKTTGGSAQFSSYYENSVPIVAGQIYTLSIFAKADTATVLQIIGREATFGLNVWANFNLANKTVGSKGSASTATVVEVEGGYYRCTLTGTASAGGIGGYAIGLADNNPAITRLLAYVPQGRGLYVWGMKLEKGAVASPFISPANGLKYGTQVEAVAPSPGANLVQNPEAFDDAYWVKMNVSTVSNTQAAPDGTMTADTLKEDTASSIKVIYENAIAITSGQGYAMSVYGKAGTHGLLQLHARGGTGGLDVWANFILTNGTLGSKGTGSTSTIESVGNGWYRCTLAGTAIASGTGYMALGLVASSTSTRQLGYGGSGKELYIWGAKLETGTIATPYDKMYEASPLASFGFGTDLHYNPAITSYVGLYPSAGNQKLADAVNYWNTRGLDFVLIDGDYTDAGHAEHGTTERTKAESISDLQYIDSVFAGLTTSRYLTIGNHDMDKVSKAELIANTSITSNYYFFDKGGVRFIVLDACYLSDADGTDFDSGNHEPENHLTAYVPPAERTWLTNTLASATGKAVVFCHQSLNSNTDPLSVKNAAAVRTILENSGKVIAVLTGHEHVNRKDVINGIPYYSMAAMAATAYPNNAYAVVKVYQRKVVIEGRGTQQSYN
jgi:hypothetical protein